MDICLLMVAVALPYRAYAHSVDLRQEAEYNTVDETDAAAAEAQFDKKESDPDLDLWPPGVSAESA